MHPLYPGLVMKAGTEQGTGRQLGLYIRQIVAGSVAARDGRLQKNDKLLSINGIDLDGMDNARCVSSRSSARACACVIWGGRGGEGDQSWLVGGPTRWQFCYNACFPITRRERLTPLLVLNTSAMELLREASQGEEVDLVVARARRTGTTPEASPGRTRKLPAPPNCK